MLFLPNYAKIGSSLSEAAQAWAALGRMMSRLVKNENSLATSLRVNDQHGGEVKTKTARFFMARPVSV